MSPFPHACAFSALGTHRTQRSLARQSCLAVLLVTGMPCSGVHARRPLAIGIFVHLLLRRREERGHRDATLVGLGVKRGLDGSAEDCALDVAAREVEALSELFEVDVWGNGRGFRNVHTPELGAHRSIRRVKLEDELEAPMERRIHLRVPVGDCDRDAAKLLHVMEQHPRVHRVMARRRAAVTRPLAEETLCLVKDEHRVLPLGLDENLLDVLRRLAHVLVHQLRAVDDHEGAADVEADRLRRHRLARARLSVEQCRDALRSAVLLLEAPLAEEHRLRLRVVDHVPQLLLDGLGKHNLLEPVLRHDAAIKVGHGEATPQLVRGARMEVGHRDRRRKPVARDRDRQRREPRVLDEAALELVLAREQHEVDVAGKGQLRRCHRAPDLFTQQQVRLRELDGEGDAPVHRLVEVHRPIRRQDAQPFVPLELSEHRVDLHVPLGAVHKDGLTLVEEENGVVDLGLAEHELEDRAGRVGTEGGEVDHQHLLADERREGVRHHRLARSTRTVEEQDHATAVREALVEVELARGLHEGVKVLDGVEHQRLLRLS
mmetsp:Transcript_23786/g.60832  ORF Transcript_23786/g.60832 Transcript_23786/m.60832 type:complete len:546 (-) Transcript_23786:177-1814(-)